MNRPPTALTALYAAVAVTLLVWTVIFIGMYVMMRKPAPVPATATAHEQPQIIPPIAPTVSTASNTNTNTQQKAVVVPPKEGRWQKKNEDTPQSKINSGARAHSSSAPAKKSSATAARVAFARTAFTSRAAVANSATDPYARDFMGGGKWKEEEWTTTISTTTSVVAAPMAVRAANRSDGAPTSASTANADGTPTVTASDSAKASDCSLFVVAAQKDCATANSWYAQIAAHYGSAMAHHYDWLRGNAAFVADYNTNGCSPSPCNANFTGRLQPADYAGALGYDSPLGTCTSTTPTKRMRGSDGKGMLPGVLDADGNLHGAVLFNGEYYDGVITDTSCTDCTVTFTHPCQLRNWNEQPAEFIAIDGTRGYTWYLGVAQ